MTMPSMITKIPSKTLTRTFFISFTSRESLYCNFCTSTVENRSQNLDRITNELLNLTKLKRYDYSILFKYKLGLNKYEPAISGLVSMSGSSTRPTTNTKVVEKTAFDIKLKNSMFTDLGLKEAKDLEEKALIVLKKGISNEEASPIVEKLKELGTNRIIMISPSH